MKPLEPAPPKPEGIRDRDAEQHGSENEAATAWQLDQKKPAHAGPNAGVVE